MREPHLPISLAARGKATIYPQSMIVDGHVRAGNHDFHCVNSTPSVNLVVDMKDPSILDDDDGVQQSFYKGVDTYCLLFAQCLKAMQHIAHCIFPL